MDELHMEELREFLIYCGKEGYATLGDDGMVVEADQSTSIRLAQGDWQFHDNYFGGEPYGGREVVFFQNKPVWIMTYYGLVNESVKELKPVYTFLRTALTHIPEVAPYRGPREFTDHEWRYENTWEGDIDNFSGEEAIYLNGKKIYGAKYLGGFINQK